MVIIMGKKKFGLAFVAILGMLISGCRAGLMDFQEELTKMEAVIQETESEVFKEDYMFISRRKNDYKNEEYIIKRDGDNYYLKEVRDYINGSRDIAETWYIKTGENMYTVYESRPTALTYREILATSNEVRTLNVLVDYYSMYYNKASNIIKNNCSEDNVVCEYSKGIFGNKTLKVTTTEGDIVNIETITIKKGKLQSASTEAVGDVINYEEIEFDYGNQNVKVSNKEAFKKS